MNNSILLQNTGRPKQLLLLTFCTAVGELVFVGTALWFGAGVGGVFMVRAVVWLGVFSLQHTLIRNLLERMPVAQEETSQRVNSNIPQA